MAGTPQQLPCPQGWAGIRQGGSPVFLFRVPPTGRQAVRGQEPWEAVQMEVVGLSPSSSKAVAH